MSCFKGQMEEYTAIAIDRFDGKNLQCTSFFLSHCHRDHMVGLNQPAFHECLSSRQDVFLYCSEISRILLLAEDEFTHLEKFIKTLEVGSTHHICVPKTAEHKDDTVVRVTPISAGHCPGSVMFLFEGKEGTTLYTGDFRWEVNKATKISAFREGNNIKSIKSLYIDTTFCVPEAYHIPSRNECLEATMDLISDWLNRNELRMVSMACPAKYGHEHLLAELAKRLNTKIHVPKWKIDIYNQIPELSGIFSHDPRECRIHACSWKFGGSRASPLPCGYSVPGKERFQVLKVRPSTMWFTSEKTKASTRDLVVAPASHRGLHRVCYSMHSSYSEIRDVVSFLQPSKVLPNVLPASDSHMEAVQTRLNGFLKMPHKARLSSSVGGSSNFEPLGQLRTKQRQASRKKLYTGCSSSEELVFSSQEQSPTKKKTYQEPVIASNASHHSEADNICEEISSKSMSGSSYIESVGDKDEELNLFSEEDADDNDDKDDDAGGLTGDAHIAENVSEAKDKVEAEEESLRLYISGESEVEGSDGEEEKKLSEHESFWQEDSLIFDSESLKTLPFENYKTDSILEVGHTDKHKKRDKLNNDGQIPGVCGHEKDTDDSNDSEVILGSQENALTTLMPFKSSYMGFESKRESDKTEFTNDEKELSQTKTMPANDCPLKHEIDKEEQESRSFHSTGDAIKSSCESEKSISDSSSQRKVMKKYGEGEDSRENSGKEADVANLMDLVLGNASATQYDSVEDHTHYCDPDNSPPLLSKGSNFSKISCTNSDQRDSCKQGLLSNSESFQRESENAMKQELKMDISDDESDCVIVDGCDDKSTKRPRKLNSSSHREIENESKTVVCNNTSPDFQHAADTSSGESRLSTNRKRQRESEVEDESVEFLYEDCVSTSSPDDDQGWLSKESTMPRTRSDKRSGQKSSDLKKQKLSQSSMLKTDSVIIDLTLDDSV